MQSLNGKFHGVIVRNLDGEIITPDQYVVFLAKDNAFLPTLEFYHKECERTGAKEEQLKAVDRLIARVKQWRSENPSRCKIPDAEPGECH